MLCVLSFIQGDITNTVGVFESRENAVEFLSGIPFVKRYTDDFHTGYMIKLGDIPDCFTVSYKGWKYTLSRFSFSECDPCEDIEAEFTELCNLDREPDASSSYVSGYTIVAGYSCDNEIVADYIAKRESLYRQAKEYYESRGRKIGRGGLGSQDGEYVLVSGGSAPEMSIAFLLDPPTVEQWERAGSFEGWLSAYGGD